VVKFVFEISYFSFVSKRQEYEIEQQQKFQLIEEEKKKYEEKEKSESMQAERWSHDKYEEIMQEEKVFFDSFGTYNV